MTALAGYWSLGGVPGEGLCRRMLAGQAIYGHEDAQRTLGPVTLGRRLWGITQEDNRDRGPVVGGDGTLMLAADMRIDNRGELTDAVGWDAGERRRASDPMLAMALVERFGVAGLERIVGPFALMLWDARAGTLTLARDAFGERPLHYHGGDGFVAVASMPAGLHALPGVTYAADVGAAADFLALLPEVTERSFFHGISRALPAHITTIGADGRVEVRRYWDPHPPTLRLASAEAYAEALAAELDRAVNCCLQRAGGGVGAHLSGGLDSSSVAATAARLIAPERLVAFTSVPSVDTPVPKGRFGDEGPHAAAVAAMHPNIDHQLIRAGATSPLDLVDKHFRVYQRPVLNLCNAAWHDAINDAAQARGLSVMLTGGMGNFTISHDGIQRLPELVRQGRGVALARLVRQLHRGGMRYRGIGAAAIGPYVPRALWRHLAAKRGREVDLQDISAIRTEAVAEHRIEERAAALDLDYAGRPWADSRVARRWAMKRVDFGVYNKGTLGGWGLDLRDPTADRRLIEFALSIPEEQWIWGGTPRSLGRRAFADRLPRMVVDERRKGLQATDWHLGIGASLPRLREELDSLARCGEAAALIDLPRLHAAVDDWPQAGWESDRVSYHYRYALLRSVAAGHFLRRVARTN